MLHYFHKNLKTTYIDCQSVVKSYFIAMEKYLLQQFIQI